jgi:hypothetical protein
MSRCALPHNVMNLTRQGKHEDKPMHTCTSPAEGTVVKIYFPSPKNHHMKHPGSHKNNPNNHVCTLHSSQSPIPCYQKGIHYNSKAMPVTGCGGL